MLTNPPRLIAEIQGKKWLEKLLSLYHLDSTLSPHSEFKNGLYTHSYRLDDPINFESFAAENTKIYESEYFKSVSIEFLTRDVHLFEKRDQYCLNGSYPKSQCWHYSGSRMVNYTYITTDTITSLRLTLQSEDVLAVTLSRETIDKMAKKAIDKEIQLIGQFIISTSPITFEIDDYSACSDEEMADLKKWKNIELSKRSQLVKIRMNDWINNLYECGVHDEEKSLRIIYLSLGQKEIIERLQNDSPNQLLKLDGKIRMFSDYTAILKSIDRIEQVPKR